MPSRIRPRADRITRAPRWRACALLGAALALAGCSSIQFATNTVTGGNSIPEGQPGHVSGFLGAVVADEPQAALIGRQALSAGGDAADAAVAMAMALSVTLPSRAGLGGGGACLAYQPKRDSPNHGVPEAILFVPLAPAQPPVGADRPAAVPMFARGLFLLHARYGHLPFELLIRPAENLARDGATASRAFVDDLRLVAGPLFADPQARTVFSRGGVPLAVGDKFIQPGLAGTLAQLRTAGVGDFYQGTLARQIVEGSRLVGAPLTLTQLRDGLPRTGAAILLGAGRNTVAFLPPPADGGLAAAAAFQVLEANPAALADASARAQEVAAAWRATGGSPTALLSAESPAAGLPPLPPPPRSGTRQGWRRGRLRAQHGQFVRHRADRAGPWLSARRLAARCAAAAARRRDRLEPRTPGLPRRGGRLRPERRGARDRRGDGEHAAQRPADAGARAGARSGQCHRVQRLPAGCAAELRLGNRPARRRPGARRRGLSGWR